MTITTRNRIILGGLALCVLLTAGFLVSARFVFLETPLDVIQNETGANMATVFVTQLAELFIIIVAVTILYFSFRKTTSPEIFFFIIFLIATSLDSLKVVQILLEVYGVSPFVGSIVSRAVYFGKFLGTLAMFAAGLFATGIQYQRMELYLLLGVLLALALTASVPLDVTTLEPNLVFRLVQHREILTVSVLFEAFAVMSFVFTGIQNANANYYFMAAGAAMAVSGREILFFRLDPISIIAAFVLLIAGITLFSERTHEVHLWG